VGLVVDGPAALDDADVIDRDVSNVAACSNRATPDRCSMSNPQGQVPREHLR
jgi:hypothetical protein